MSKRMIIVTGSPRKNGNTNTVANWVAEAGRAQGAYVEVVDAAGLHIHGHGCTACMKCQTSDKYECAIQDEVSPVIAMIPSFDVVVFATPIYWVGPSAQLKIFLDRTFSLTKSSPQGMKCAIEGKISGLIATAGGGLEDGLNQTDGMFKTAAGFSDCRYDSLLIPSAPDLPGQMASRSEIKTQAEEFAQRLLA